MNYSFIIKSSFQELSNFFEIVSNEFLFCKHGKIIIYLNIFLITIRKNDVM